MEPKAVEHSRAPAYPTRREVLAGAASMALVSLTGQVFLCADDPIGEMSVAPIFEHGEGRGATGCVVIVPPAFLAEDEALQIVNEELAQHGIQLVRGAVIKELKIASRCMRPAETEETTKKTDPGDLDDAALWMMADRKLEFVRDPERAAPLRLTGMDKKKSIAVAFVCVRYYQTLGGVDPGNGPIIERDGKRSGIMSTVKHYDFKDAAKYLATEIKDAGKQQRRLYIGVLYDPVGRPKREGDEDLAAVLQAMRADRETAAAESKKLLRQQAQEFVTWLKQHGAM